RTFKADYPNLGQLSLDAKIVGDASSPGLADMQLVLSRASDFNMVAKGSMGDMRTGNDTSMQVSGSCADKDILQMLLPEEMPEIDRLEGDLLIRDGDGVYVVEALKLTGSNEQGTTMKAEGTMGFSRAIGKAPAFRELDLNCQLSSPTTESAKFPAVDFLPELGAMSATGRVRLSGDLLRFEDLAIHSSHAQGLQVDTAGTLQISLDEAKDTPLQIDFKARVAAPNMGAAKPLLGKVYLSRAGPLLGEGRITGTSEALSIEDLSITVGESGPVRARWQGRIGRVPLSSGELPSDVDIVGAIDADEASVVASLAAISLPKLGPLKTTLRIVEQGGVYGFKDIRLSVGSQEKLWAKGAGSFDLVTKNGSVSLSGLDVEVEASAPNLAAVPKAADLDLPDLRPLKLTAHIIDPDGRLDILDVKEFTFDAGTGEDAFLTIQAQASGLRSSDQRVLEASFKTTSRPWVMKLLEGSAPGNHVVEGKLKIAGTPEHIRIEELEVGTTGPKRLYLEAGGTVKEIEGTHEIEGHIASGASHISVLGSFLGIEVPPFGAPQVDGKIAGNTTKSSFEGTVRLGSSLFRTSISHSLTKKRPRVTAKIVAPTVYLADVGVYPKQPKDLPPEIESEPQPDKRLFSDKPLPFHALKAIDLAVSVDVKRMMGEDFVLRDLDFDMSLENGKLRIAPATVIYENGSASIDCTVDAVSSKPEMAFKITAEDIDIGALLAHFHAQPFVKGQLNLVVDLQSSGKSPREIATALEGEFRVAVEEGKIKRVVEFMGADAVDFLTEVRSKVEYRDLHCLALGFVFEEGMGNSEMIYLESPKMYARGGAQIDFHTETIKMVLQPKPKRGLRGMTSAVTIKGPIVDPQVRKIPFREAAKLYGEIFMPMVFLPARGLGYLWYLIKKDKEEDSPCLHVIPQDK
ncbi:MAG: AsmA family protein, partial [Deltaproteobacteria bacterium]|nr:AsmA family protein [Deltaproteobacteria bacterium]